MKAFHLITSLAVAVAALTSCSKEPVPGTDLLPDLTPKHRTVIEYMVADNNLYPYAERDINEMERGWRSDFNGYMVVFFYPVDAGSRYAPSKADYDPDPRLILISRNEDDTKIASRVLKRYDRTLNPCDPATMQKVLADAITLAPAENYGLVLWSHGSGWIPKGLGQPLKSTVPATGDALWTGSKLEGFMDGLGDNVTSQGGTVGYSFGASDSNGKSEMEVDALAAALPAGITFDFMLFDACHMACAEVAWQLKDKTDYLIASVAETLADGFPYEKIMPRMMAPTADVQGIAADFFDHYDALSGQYQSGTVSVVKSSALPRVAAAVKTLCESGLPASGIFYAGQQYGRSAMGFKETFYDLGNFVYRTWPQADLTEFEAAMAEAVVYKAATPWLFNSIAVRSHSGLSCYLPRSLTPKSLEAYRTRFPWSTASGMGALVP